MCGSKKKIFSRHTIIVLVLISTNKFHVMPNLYFNSLILKKNGCCHQKCLFSILEEISAPKLISKPALFLPGLSQLIFPFLSNKYVIILGSEHNDNVLPYLLLIGPITYARHRIPAIIMILKKDEFSVNTTNKSYSALDE